ncbi:MAG: bifunctional diaminohydroxyphosphoribosylaminopyrimidine deaminase/5-amino-6-(5-phosphoribosylamino)uracil reductase RibD [Candidatus Saganbacteria bacterium]|nr:bifunctional diaminohydroxyphosphoribosylaminopyrimidine deaminase/5-amino-6-(5-phosphoribosylamino)uracil reductase RibD [Candidatus Saganbacteria bacterium]
MRQAIELASSQRGKTSPDPMVGALVVVDGKKISEGYHSRVRTPHAEAWAIKKAGKLARGATIYVNLEPCCFFKAKANPPCTQTIISAKIKKVFIAMVDPNPMVAGKGIAELRGAGVAVEVGLLEKEAKALNEVFIKFITTNRPFVTLKSAMSLDGKIATTTGESFWITGIESRQRAHYLRSINDAVMVGIGTIIKDDPELTVRHLKGEDPIIIIVDSKLTIPKNSKVLSNSPEKVIILTGKDASRAKKRSLEKRGVQVLSFPLRSKEINLDVAIKELGGRGITSILIEGGGRLNASALKYDIVDKINFFIAPMIIGGSFALTPVEGAGIKKISEVFKLKDTSVARFGEDILIEGYLIH